MAILKSLVSAPLLICGFAICSPVSAETMVNNDMTPVMSPAAKNALKDLKAMNPTAPVTIVHTINWGDLKKIGCPGGVRYDCNVKHKFVFAE